MTKDFNLVVNRQALVLFGKCCQLGNACIRPKNRLAVADKKRGQKAALCVHGHQNIDGLSPIATYRLEVYRLKHITFEFRFGVWHVSAFAEQWVKRHARLHFTHHKNICKDFVDVFFK